MIDVRGQFKPPDKPEERRSMKKRTPEQTVEATDALLREIVEHLSRDCAPHLLGMTAHDDLLDMRPQLEEALGALAEIEHRRDLTVEEFTRRRVFRALHSSAIRLSDESSISIPAR